jgi:hypothetical protein
LRRASTLCSTRPRPRKSKQPPPTHMMPGGAVPRRATGGKQARAGGASSRQ